MPREAISNLLRYGFPKESNDGKSNKTLLEYVGLETDLRRACPKLGTVFGEYLGIVSDAQIEPLEGTGYAILSISTELRYDQTAEITGSKQETSYEVDWVTISRPLKEHPKFQADGAFTLTSADLVEIDEWANSGDQKTRKLYQYPVNPEYGLFAELSANGKKYAAGILQGFETFDDHVPVARVTETWVNGPPGTSTAGLKDDPPSFPNLPGGYEWIKTADRSLRAGGQFRWERNQEWMGVHRVFIDAADFYYTTP